MIAAYALYCVIVLGKVNAIASREICGVQCCTHYYREKESCIACPNGTKREATDHQNTCQPCPEGKYGYRCTIDCTCKITTHICNPVTGRCCCRINPTECVADNNCSSKGNHETQTLTTAKGTVVFGITISMVVSAALIFGIISCALRNKENCLRRDLNKCISRIRNAGRYVIENHFMPSQANQAGCDVENNDTSEGHYCDIRDSAIIQSLTSPQDDCQTEDYNHLNLSCSDETQYKCNENVYFKLSQLKASENNQNATSENRGTISLYDQMETLNSGNKSLKHPNYNTMGAIKAGKYHQAKTESRRNESLDLENTSAIPVYNDTNSNSNGSVIVANGPISDDLDHDN